MVKSPLLWFQRASTLALASVLLGCASPALAAQDQAQSAHKGGAPCLSWIDVNTEPWAVLLCVHGLGLDNGSYGDFGKRMQTAGVATYAVDVRGFGSWQKAQGRELIDFADCLEDVHGALKVIHRAHPTLPVFILGESMGGGIVLRVTAQWPQLIKGVIASTPASRRFKQGSQSLKVAMRFLSGPNKQFNVGSSVIEQASQDNLDLKRRWCTDPMARFNLSPKELIQFQRFMNENDVYAKLITSTPVLVVAGQKDMLVKPEANEDLFDRIASPDKQLAKFEEAQHLIFEEGQFNEQEIKLVVDWLHAHTRINTEAAGSGAPAHAPTR